jgi:hypothetical protein
MDRNDPPDLPRLMDAMKHSADTLRTAGIPFALCGGLAAFARGGKPSGHDVDLLIRDVDIDAALATLEASGLRTERPPEGWLVKAYQEDVLVDLIFRPVERPVTDETLADTDLMSVGAIQVPVLSGTELLIHSLLTLSAHACDMAPALQLTRSIREQIDFDRVRDQTKHSPYARALLYLADELELIPGGDRG